MLNVRAKLGIAEFVFYMPATAVAAYLLFFRHGKPRMAWILLFVFSLSKTLKARFAVRVTDIHLVRLAGGIVLILWTFHPNSIGLIIATLALLGAGVFPLIVATLGLLRIIINVHFQDYPRLRSGVIFTRMLFGVGVALVVAGGSLEGQYDNPNLSSLGLKLVKAGYVLVLVIFIILIGFEMYFWKNWTTITAGGLSILKATSGAVPFIAVRITYALLSVFGSGGLQSKWSNLYGSVGAYVTMGLVMEYIVMLMYLGVGVRIPPVKRMK